MKKISKSCILLKRPKIAFLGEIFFSGYPPPLGVGGSQVKLLELSFPHRVFTGIKPYASTGT